MIALSVVGARPQFIKLGPLSRELRKKHHEIIIHTGQHYDHSMSDLFFQQLDISRPDINLGIGSGSHGYQTGRMLEFLEKELLNIKPDLVICFGDTNSTLSACLAASKLDIPSVHVEAGLRSFNRSMPEEINRIVADHTADLLFAPTSTAMDHLKREGLKERAVLTGDIMVDSIAFIKDKIAQTARTQSADYMLMTLHRPYTVDDPNKLGKLLRSLQKLNSLIVFPVHPRTRNIILKNKLSVPENIQIIDPQGYIEFQGLLKYCRKIITDSGGLQKEAYIWGKPCITLRPETEWVETVSSGWNILLDTDDPDLAEKIDLFSPTASQVPLFGEQVAERMVNELESWFHNHNERKHR